MIMEIQRQDSLREPDYVDVINGIVPRIGETITNIKHYGVVASISYDFEGGTIFIKTTENPFG